MRLLLDTHPYLWLLEGDRRLSRAVAEAYEDPANEFLLSVASLWEATIKISLGKLAISNNLAEFLERQPREQGIAVLQIEVSHLRRLGELAHHHRDPFDRLLAAQSLAEGIPIISMDGVFDAYGVSRYW
ncbi:MAG: type II toxin-antitoxin system VapC family toxin [Candidatus Sericytochromatia bacterium]|nr:type II toxin-antitoxin system VapC family toxin [Candidatus Tanganyikabacteria bacterium]